MWQRFTERARRVILLGQEEAAKMNSSHVGTEHLLLGLVRENEGVAAQVLQKMGVSLEKVRQEIEAEVEPSAEPSPAEPKLTPKAKRVLELAADEARRMRHNYIGTEHLLLALLRDQDSVAATVLRRLGLNLEEARKQVMYYIGPEVPRAREPVALPPSPEVSLQKLLSALNAAKEWAVYNDEFELAADLMDKARDIELKLEAALKAYLATQVKSEPTPV
ncbi:MAG: hypothetical protein M3347_19015, partial [Armatimonadota bacterium]|nr:hypothetical protein [Armatimonadota bacterium]